MLLCVCVIRQRRDSRSHVLVAPQSFYAGACGLDLEHPGRLVVLSLEDRCDVSRRFDNLWGFHSASVRLQGHWVSFLVSYTTRWCPLCLFWFSRRERPPLGSASVHEPRGSPTVRWLSSPLFCVFIFGAPTEEGCVRPSVYLSFLLGGVTHKYVSVSRGFNRRDFLIPFFTHFLHTEGCHLKGVFTVE